MRRGFTMIEMLGVLVILGFVAAMGGQLFFQTVNAINAERDALNRQSARDALLSRLRADALRATALTPLDNGVRITTAEGVSEHTVATASDRPQAARSIVAERGAIRVRFGEGDEVLILAPFAAGGGGER